MIWWLWSSVHSNAESAHGLTRAALAALAAFTVALLIGPRLIGWLRCHCPETIANDSARLNQLHRHKADTPSMGGLLIVGGAIAAIVVCCLPRSPFVWLSLLILFGFGGIGVLDDLCKRRKARGISARVKLAMQSAIALVVALASYLIHEQTGSAGVLNLPFVGGEWSIGLWYIPFAAVVLVGASNSVNLTDGLDGLASGCLLCALAALALLAFGLSSPFWSAWFNLPAAPAAGEMAIVAAALIGALLGFLWFNCHPAQLFMGDSGSLPLGGLLGLIAIACRQELLLLLIGGVFVVEALSVILQVASFRTMRRRLFLCAPLHHHFQFAGWSESKIVVRFWIAALCCSAIGMMGVTSRPEAQNAITGEAGKLELSRTAELEGRRLIDLDRIGRIE